MKIQYTPRKFLTTASIVITNDSGRVEFMDHSNFEAMYVFVLKAVELCGLRKASTKIGKIYWQRHSKLPTQSTTVSWDGQLKIENGDGRIRIKYMSDIIALRNKLEKIIS